MNRRAYTPEEIALSTAAMARSENDLLLDLGILLAGPGASRDGDPDDLLGRANNWFDRNRREMAKRLCGHPDLQQLTDGIVDASAVADLIADLTGKTAGYTVAAIILKRGLNWLCG